MNRLKQIKVELCAELLSVVANPVRLKILMLLVQEEVSVKTIATHVDASQSAVSQHLAKLRRKGLVHSRRDAQTIYYSSRSSVVFALLQTLKEISNELPD
ncbi:metalloregulator ArsR/SmtB family transcription factor [Rhizobium sp. BK602]|uniref:ArsR/SmtB family transcription factor n=1 Tax=Rhizobium sp. BK602 TaxID=2586986 RepID=UPI001614E7A4|nr:metalloregulator ArsR/SmtB family transcription factor [Rhizobium sp. BK602]